MEAHCEDGPDRSILPNTSVEGIDEVCGIVTPFKGIRCYTRCAMGMPGSETALEELICRVLGDLVEGGHVVKIADDLYCGAETCDELLAIWPTTTSQRKSQAPCREDSHRACQDSDSGIDLEQRHATSRSA